MFYLPYYSQSFPQMSISFWQLPLVYLMQTLKSFDDGIRGIRAKLNGWDEERKTSAAVVSNAILNSSGAAANLSQLQTELKTAEEFHRAVKHPSMRLTLEQLTQRLQAVTRDSGLPLSTHYSSSITELNTRYFCHLLEFRMKRFSQGKCIFFKDCWFFLEQWSKKVIIITSS